MSDRIEKIKTFLQSNPKDSFLNHALALEYIKIGEEEKAKSHFEVNLANEPEYIATYYHLGKLNERLGAKSQAMSLYELGMKFAKKVNDMHTYSELQGALDDLMD